MRLALLVLLAALFSANGADAAVPQGFTLNLQVFDEASPDGFSSGGPIVVKLFGAETGGTFLWTETHSQAAIDHGFLSLKLGSGTDQLPIGKTIAEVLLEQASLGSPVFLELVVDEKQLQRMELSSVPYALACSEAETALTLDESAAAAFSLASHSHAWTAITGKPAAFLPEAHTHLKAQITDWPLTFPPEAHNHDAAYLAIKGTAANAQMLDDLDSTAFAKTADLTTVSTSLTTNYYSKTELTTGGKLDGRYYTKTDADAAFALITELKKALTRLDAAEAKITTQAATITELQAGDCPSGYTKVADANILATGYYCRKAVGGGKYDEMVRVGDYWIDRYEMSVWLNADCSGTQYGGASDNWTSGGATGANGDNGFFPRNGNWTKQLYSCSVPGVVPSRFFTFFQAQAACQLSDKHLCTNGEWQGAAQGTVDPGAWPDADSSNGCTSAPVTGRCNTCSTGPRKAGDAWYLDLANSCMSVWGAFDLVGNLWEWTDHWGQAGRTKYDVDGGKFASGYSPPDSPWPAAGYGSDGTWNLNGEAHDGGAYKSGLPASALRGGHWGYGSRAGVFALDLSTGPSYWTNDIGARCCRRK